MAGFMRPFESQVYALFRIVTGLLFLWHGTQKLFGFPVPIPAEMSPPAWIIYGGGTIELVGGVLVMIGLFTTWAAFICSGQMAVAYWLGHGLGLMGTFSIFPLVNHGELAVLYCFAFLFISARGAGIWSVDGTRSS
jgi:putative oxidoreductase